MKYLEGSFSVFPGSSKNYRDNWDRIFKKENEVEVKKESKEKIEPIEASKEDDPFIYPKTKKSKDKLKKETKPKGKK